MYNFKDILKDNWCFYKDVIGKYNVDNVTYAKIEARTQEELIEKSKDIMIKNLKNF